MTDTTAARIARQIAEEIGARANQVTAAVSLLDDGATVPFIARYRKEVTGGLDDTQLRSLETRLSYLRELEDRRTKVLASIDEQGKLTDDLKEAIAHAETKARLEDLYLPYKPKRRTRAQNAREAGLEPLLDALLADPCLNPHAAAADYVDANKKVDDADAALDGARQILIERAGEHADLLGELREWYSNCARLVARVIDGKESEGAKYRDYFEYSEPLKKAPSHRVLAMLRGRNEGVLSIELEPGSDPAAGHEHAIARVAHFLGIEDRGRPTDSWLETGARLAWKARVQMNLQVELMVAARERAEAEAIRIFGNNLGDLMLAAPAGARTVLGLDPGLRTGTKAVVIDGTGKLLDTATIYPLPPQKRVEEALDTLGALCRKHEVELIAIGNGTASREIDQFVGHALKQLGLRGIQKLVVSEAGASVYSASELAAKEFPNLDVSLRGAVSIARRLQDPLAELVKIEPRAIGVGQYQHDVDQHKLAKTLDARVEDCVNAVGVHVNTASSALLARVAGLNATVADNIVSHRDDNGPFRRRKDLLKVPRLGAKGFEQAAGFLRIADGDDPLDASAVHPEAYPVVKRILEKLARPVTEVIGDSRTLRALNAQDFADARFGLPTVQDILKELEKPGRDPRPEFETAKFTEGVDTIKDLRPGMILEGTVSNVAAFGAFVDLGVHQDGLVHISAMSDKFVKDPRTVVKAGQVVKVKVMNIDLERKRIALSLRLDDPLPDETDPTAKGDPKPPRPKSKSGKKAGKQSPSNTDGTLAEAFARAKAK
ncbi:Tex family protein [Wenzhouxiangella sp. EGI_FJ10305]|uniref:Tex family protein n=1 Tax=Wenzhouxiangella sp. EGI_FJ10305 TaxID=3243768 RepID=UPI0035DD9308